MLGVLEYSPVEARRLPFALECLLSVEHLLVLPCDRDPRPYRHGALCAISEGGWCHAWRELCYLSAYHFTRDLVPVLLVGDSMVKHIHALRSITHIRCELFGEGRSLSFLPYKHLALLRQGREGGLDFLI